MSELSVSHQFNGKPVTESQPFEPHFTDSADLGTLVDVAEGQQSSSNMVYVPPASDRENNSAQANHIKGIETLCRIQTDCSVESIEFFKKKDPEPPYRYEYVCKLISSSSIRNLQIDFEDNSRDKDEERTRTITSQYLFTTTIASAKGADLAILDKKLGWYGPYEQIVGPGTVKKYWNGYLREDQIIDMDTEDLWLFEIFRSEGSVEILIGPYSFLLDSNFHIWRSVADHSQSFDLRNRDGRWHYVAIKVPKMTNPAISVGCPAGNKSGTVGLASVSLLLRRDIDGASRFASIKLSPIKLPAWRTSSGLGHDPDGPIELKGSGTYEYESSIMLFPKQLYGSSGIDNNLWRKFVQQKKPDTFKHAAMWHQKNMDKPPSYSASQLSAYWWYSRNPTQCYGFASKVLDYCSGEYLDQKYENGMAMLLTTFSSMLKVVGALVKQDYLGAIQGTVAGILDADKFRDRAEAEGFVSATISATVEAGVAIPPGAWPNNWDMITIEDYVAKNWKMDSPWFGGFEKPI